MSKVELGKKYKDIVHGVEGIATTYCSYLTGCDRVTLQYLDKDGNIKDRFLDVTQCEEVKDFKQIIIPVQITEEGDKKTGGPNDMIEKPSIG